MTEKLKKISEFQTHSWETWEPSPIKEYLELINSHNKSINANRILLSKENDKDKHTNILKNIFDEIEKLNHIQIQLIDAYNIYFNNKTVIYEREL